MRILASVDAPRAAKAVRHVGEGMPLAPCGGALLRALRRKSRLSLVEVALRLGVAASTISRWEASVSHPAPEMTEALLNLLNATPEERVCLAASGVAKIKAERPAFDAAYYRSELDKVEASLRHGGSDGAELRLLQLQSLLWWSLREPEARDLWRRAHGLYARYLALWERYPEAISQAEIVLEAESDPSDPLSIAALRVVARADVHRWLAPRPHIGLFSLQRALVAAKDEAARVEILADMADYSRLAGRITEALSYAERAVVAANLAESDDLRFAARGALGSAFVAAGRTDEGLTLLSARVDEPLRRAETALRRAQALGDLERYEGARTACEEVLRLIEEGWVAHLRADVERRLGGLSYVPVKGV